MIDILEILNEIAVTEEVSSEQPIEDSQVQETDVTETTTDSSEEIAQDTPQMFEVDGEQLTLEQIKEYRQGYLRQSDYTKKTQSIAQEKARLKEAVELYDYLQSNPDIAQKLVEQDTSVKGIAPTQENNLLKELNYKIATMELDTQLNNLKAKDSSLDEVELLTIANENGCNLDVAYNIYRGKNFDKILQAKLKEQSLNLTKQIKENGQTTKTLISGADKSVDKGTYGLSDAQIEIAQKLNMTLEEYSKWL